MLNRQHTEMADDDAKKNAGSCDANAKFAGVGSRAILLTDLCLRNVRPWY